MAKTAGRQSKRKPARWPWFVALVIAFAIGLVWMNRATISGYSSTATAYSARVACSCRFVAGRSLESCMTDRLGGMELVTLAEDAEARSVTARFPLLSSATATHREGFGCVLERWED